MSKLRAGWRFGADDASAREAEGLEEWVLDEKMSVWSGKVEEAKHYDHDDAASSFDWTEVWPELHFDDDGGRHFTIEVKSPEGEVKRFNMLTEWDPIYSVELELKEGAK